jgi:hypothetical protein
LLDIHDILLYYLVGLSLRKSATKTLFKMGHNKSFSQNDDFEFDEAYFRKIYKPLSNLPTPPPSSHNSSATQSPRILAEDLEQLNAEFLGTS